MLRIGEIEAMPQEAKRWEETWRREHARARARRKRVIMKSPAILASKERLRRRRAERVGGLMGRKFWEMEAEQQERLLGSGRDLAEIDEKPDHRPDAKSLTGGAAWLKQKAMSMYGLRNEILGR